MKKKDIIQLVKETIKEVGHGQYQFGNRQGPNSFSTSATAPAGKDPYTGKNEYPFFKRPKRTGTGMMEAGPSNNPYYNNLVKKAEKMGIHVNDLMKSLLKDKSEMEIAKMGYQDLAALAGVENLSEFKQPKSFDPDTISLLRPILNVADIHHNELVGGYDEVSSYLDKRTGGTIIKFPHFNGPQGRGALFGKETSDQIDSSKAKAKAAALKVYTQFKQYIEDYEISDASPAGVYGNIYLWVMFNDLAKDYTAPKGGTQSSQFETIDEEEVHGKEIVITAGSLQNALTFIGRNLKSLSSSMLSRLLNILKLSNINDFPYNVKDLKSKLKQMTPEEAKTFGLELNKFRTDMKRKNIRETTIVSKMTDLGTAGDIAKAAGTTKDAVMAAIAAAKKTGDEVTVAEQDLEDLTFEPEDMDNPDEDLVIIGSAALDIENPGERPSMTNGEYAAKGQEFIDRRFKGNKAAALKYIYKRINEGEFTNDVGKDDYVDDEGRMAKSQMYKTGKYAMKLHDMLDDMEQLPAWVQAKLTKASDYLSAVYHYLDYEFVRRDSNLMEHVDKHKKRSMLMEGAMKKFFEMFDQGKTDEEIVLDYAQKGTTVPEPFVTKARRQYEGMKKMKLELEMSEKEFRNSSEKMVNNAEEGMEPGMDEKKLASKLYNEEEVDEVSYDNSNLENPKAADISKDGDISDYELKRGKAIEKAIDKQKNK